MQYFDVLCVSRKVCDRTFNRFFVCTFLAESASRARFMAESRMKERGARVVDGFMCEFTTIQVAAAGNFEQFHGRRPEDMCREGGHRVERTN
jgi:hypothetical protein